MFTAKVILARHLPDVSIEPWWSLNVEFPSKARQGSMVILNRIELGRDRHTALILDPFDQSQQGYSIGLGNAQEIASGATG